MADARVIVVGSVNSDVIVRVKQLPRPGETVIDGTLVLSDGGKGANTAAAAARLGAATELVGIVGDDERGHAARGALVDAGVGVEHIGTADEPTGLATVLVDERGENLIAVASGANVRLTGSHVAAALEALAEVRTSTVVVACLEVPDEAVLAAARAARVHGWPFVLDPAPARPLAGELVALCRVLTPNEHELAVLAPGGPELLLEAGAGAVLVTRGAAGAELHRPGRPKLLLPAFPAAVVDTTGAGDALAAAVATALGDGRELEEAAMVAAAAGALATRGAGARGGLPSAVEIHDLMAGAHAPQRSCRSLRGG